MYPRLCGTQYVTSELCIQDSVLCIQDSVGHNMSLLNYVSKILSYVSKILSYVSKILSYVSKILCYVSKILWDTICTSVLCIQDSVGHTICHFCAMYPRLWDTQYVTSVLCIQDSGTQYVTSVLYIQDSGTHNISLLCYVSRTLSKSCFVNTRTLPAKSSVRSRWVSGELWAMSHSSGCRNCVGVWRWSVSPALRWAEWASRRVVGALAGRDLRSRRSVSSPGTVALMLTLARSFDLITS